MSCLFEPIYGRYPPDSICDSYPDCAGCNFSDPFKQSKQTNADRIRAMTDEELAEWLTYLRPWITTEPEMWIKWLKQEAE